LSTRADQCKKNEDEKCQSYQTQTPALEKTKFSPLCSDPNNTSDDIKPVMLTEEELAKLLVDVEKEMSSLITLKTDMTQEKHLAMFNDVLRSKGVCIFQKPDKVRMDTISPYRSSLITSGNRVVKYNFSNDKWVKLKLPSKDIVLMITHQIAGFIQGKFDTKDSIYDISAYKGRSTTVVLTPKNEKLKETLNRIEISLSEDRYKITSVTIYEEGEDFTLMRFNNELENIELPKDTFDTHPAEPTDVKIPSPPIYLKTKSSDTKTEKEK
jgi:outer membrane lipoprotein-sorting protein